MQQNSVTSINRREGIHYNRPGRRTTVPGYSCRVYRDLRVLPKPLGPKNKSRSEHTKQNKNTTPKECSSCALYQTSFAEWPSAAINPAQTKKNPSPMFVRKGSVPIRVDQINPSHCLPHTIPATSTSDQTLGFCLRESVQLVRPKVRPRTEPKSVRWFYRCDR